MERNMQGGKHIFDITLLLGNLSLEHCAHGGLLSHKNFFLNYGAKINRVGYHLVIVIQKKITNKKNIEKYLTFVFKCCIFASF